MKMIMNLRAALPVSGVMARSRCYSVKSSSTVSAVGRSLADKGFLRPQKPYSPSADVAKDIQAICTDKRLPLDAKYKLKSLEEKFEFLQACFVTFKHAVPNSQIHEMKTMGDVLQFYETSVSTTTPFDSLVQMNLPENLHIQRDYVRFNPESDTKFKGQTAFPKSSTLVTGLKYRGKYEGNEAKRSWP